MSGLSEPKASRPDWPRYAPDVALPPYRFVPGLNPHPTHHPKGHSYERDELELEWLPADDWDRNTAYLYGVDLYNFAFWWEAHEAWEGFWHTTDKRAPQGQFIQGLIQVAAALFKLHQRKHSGALRLSELGLGRLRFVLESAEVRAGCYMGLDLAGFVGEAAEFFSVAGAPDEGGWPPLRLALGREGGDIQSR